MYTRVYLDIFKQAADRIDQKMLVKKKVEIATGIVLDSVFLKLYKKSWANAGEDPLTAESRIFFSVWINDAAIKQQKLLYNIHALKMRKLKGYSIQSREFANAFRKSFKPVQHKWKNVSVDFGPLTLMEGWLPLNADQIEKDILSLAHEFLSIDHLIDDTLSHFKS